jgi:RNA polymerase sigma-70 factor, ECF subfamily
MLEQIATSVVTLVREVNELGSVYERSHNKRPFLATIEVFMASAATNTVSKPTSQARLSVVDAPLKVHTKLTSTPTQAMSAPLTDAAQAARDLDLQLVERAQRGDKKAFEILVVKYQLKLERLLMRMVRDQDEIADIVQESFIKAYRALGSFRGESAFYTWLYRIAVNTAKNYMTASGRRMPTSTGVDAEEAENTDDSGMLQDMLTPESALISKQIAQTVTQAIEELPEEFRLAITLRELDGLSYEEISEIMGCPIGTVRSRLFRARETIAAKLRPQLGTKENQRW